MKQDRYFSFVLFLFLLIGSGSNFAQNKAQTDPAIHKHPLMEVPKFATVDVHERTDDWMAYMKNTRVIHEPGLDIEKDKFREIKAEANRLKAETMGTVIAPSNKTQAATPVLGHNFLGNAYDGIPNDNCLAISDGGFIVSGTNSRICAFDSTGLLQFWNTFGIFVAGQAGNGIKFDPKVVYDNQADRFIFVFLNGSNSSNSRVVVYFSTTNDPNDNWNVYTLDGDVLPNHWTDFPQIGISQDELFITGNLFGNNSGPDNGSAVWQIEKADGYAGNSLTVQRYDTPYFSLHPVQGGTDLYGPNFYMIRNVNFGASRDLYLHEFTNTIANGGTLSAPVTYQFDISYTTPADATQPNTTRALSTNDNRIQSSYFQNGRLEMVWNCGLGGRPAVFHGTGILAGPFSTFTGRIISDPVKEIAYPAIAYAGLTGLSGENASLIMTNHTSSTDFPGNGCWFVDVDGTVSDYLVCRQGVAAIGGGSQTWRWGDYADISEKTNRPGEAWIGGSHGQNSGGSGTYISQVYAPGTVSREPDVQDLEAATLTTYPNPTVDLVRFNFEVPAREMYRVSVRDIHGKELAVLLEDALKSGEAMLQFNTSHLQNGLYFVVIQRGNEKIFQDKFIVKR